MAFKQVAGRAAIFRPWATPRSSPPPPAMPSSAFTPFLEHLPSLPQQHHPHPLPLPKRFELPYPPPIPGDHHLFGEKEAKWKAKKQRPKKFQCETCQVSFSNNGQLIAHRRIHSGERPFACDYEGCKKTFTRNEELTRHKRIHTGVRPHSCVLCGKSFGRKDHLHKHIKTHQRTNVVRLQAFQGLPYFVSDCIPWF